MQQFAQRISLRRTTAPLNEQQTYEYIQHRLKIVGHKGSGLFSKNAMNLIWLHSEGIPRKINILCDNLLLNAYGMGLKKIKAMAVAEAINDLSFGRNGKTGGKPNSLFVQSKAAML
jgi:general secretion pathway protein A